jgi:hypothetical protein
MDDEVRDIVDKRVARYCEENELEGEKTHMGWIGRVQTVQNGCAG